MPAHVFADQLYIALRIRPTGRMHGTGLRGDGLPCVQRVQCMRQGIHVDL